MSDTDISTAAVERLLDGVTAGPWVSTEADILGERTDVVMGLEYYVASIHCHRAEVDAKANNRFIAASRDLVPALLADRDRLQRENENLRQIERNVQAVREHEHQRANAAEADRDRLSAEVARLTNAVKFREDMHECAMAERDDCIKDWSEAKSEIASLTAERDAAMAGRVKVKPLVYVGSKAAYGPEWRNKRDAGYPVISSWIDQCGVGETADWPALWQACISEASVACALVLICRDGDTLKGAWAEVGAALSSGRRVFAAGIEHYSIRHHPMVTMCATEEDAFSQAEQFAAIAAVQPDTERAEPVADRSSGDRAELIVQATWQSCAHGGGWWVALDADGRETLLSAGTPVYATPQAEPVGHDAMHRSFPDAGDGRPLPPMGDDLMTAGLSAEDARFVAVRLAQNGLTLVSAQPPQAREITVQEALQSIVDDVRLMMTGKTSLLGKIERTALRAIAAMQKGG